MNATSALALATAALSLSALGCATGPVALKLAPAAALAAAAERLTERGVALDPAGSGPNRLRTTYVCYHAPDREGGGFDRSFARPSPGPVPFTHAGTLAAQAEVRARCPLIFRIDIEATPGPDGGTRLEARSAWWRLAQAGCAPQGDPLLGEALCRYTWRGTPAADDAEAFVHALVQGL